MVVESDKATRSVRLIGWTYVGMAVLFILGGALLLALLYVASSMDVSGYALPDDAPGITPAALPEDWVSSSMFMSLTSIVIGIGLLVCSVEFLKFKRWARTATEVITWLSLLHNLVLGWIIWRMGSKLAVELQPLLEDPSAFRTASLAGAFVVGGLFSIPFLLMLRTLRSPAVLKMFGDRPSTAPPVNADPEKLEVPPERV